jgi:phosphoribosyl 1,2-cyclic phosphodiesterase
MEISALASGSSGNCFYVGNNSSGVLVDAGISAKQILSRLSLINKKPESIKAILLTHEHADHIRGADVFSRNFNIPIFCTNKTSSDSFICSNKDSINSIKNHENFKIAGLDIETFKKSHKARDPVFFSLSLQNKKVSVITDLGYCCSNVISEVGSSNAVFLESNHDPAMLDEGPYPYYLKKWVKGDDGHLSNTQAGLCALEHANSRLKNIILSHISKTNNTPELALKTFYKLIKERKNFHPNVLVSNREMPTKIIKI